MFILNAKLSFKKKKNLKCKACQQTNYRGTFSKKKKIIIQPYNLGRRGKLIK